MLIRRNSTRLIVNTGAQYTRTVINLVLSLYSTRLILNALGVVDYGIFTLIAGVVSMLSFMTNAMVTTTQRFLSYHQAKSDLKTQQEVFGNSLLMHLFFCLIVLALLEVAGLFLFDGFLNILPERIEAAKIVYQCAIFMILLSFITAPFKALLIAHENLVYISFVEVCDGIVKVLIALALTQWGADKLILYGYLMSAIYGINLLAFLIYDFRHYEECVVPSVRNLNKSYLKSMSSFIGWQLYSTGCIIGRTQGTAIVLNRFFGTVINASFGIALHVNGAVSFVSSSLFHAIAPQIVKAEGIGNRQKMFRLAETASKFGFLLLAVLVVPIICCMETLLQLWLGYVPAGSVLFCRAILITALIDQITLGLGTANTAIGDIRNYSLVINTIKLITLPILIVLLWVNINLHIAIWCYPVIELLCALCRLPYLKINGGLRIREYAKHVFMRIFVPFVFLCLSYSIINYLQMAFVGFCVLGLLVTLLYILLIYVSSLETEERILINSFISRISNRP